MVITDFIKIANDLNRAIRLIDTSKYKLEQILIENGEDSCEQFSEDNKEALEGFTKAIFDITRILN